MLCFWTHHILHQWFIFSRARLRLIFFLCLFFRLGLLTKSQATSLNEIYKVNPLLYDFVLKRAISYRGHKFPASVFQEHPALRVSNVAPPEVLLRAVPADGTHDTTDDADMYENDEALFGTPRDELSEEDEPWFAQFFTMQYWSLNIYRTFCNIRHTNIAHRSNPSVFPICQNWEGNKKTW